MSSKYVGCLSFPAYWSWVSPGPGVSTGVQTQRRSNRTRNLQNPSRQETFICSVNGNEQSAPPCAGIMKKWVCCEVWNVALHCAVVVREDVEEEKGESEF